MWYLFAFLFAAAAAQDIMDCALNTTLDEICLCQNVTAGLRLHCVPTYQKTLDILGGSLPDGTVYLNIQYINDSITLKSYQINSTSLKTLQLSKSEFVGMEEGVLGGVPNLEELILTDNMALQTLPNNLVAHVPKLMTLFISRSNLTGIESLVLAKGTNLTALTLNDLNLDSIPDGFLADCGHLQFLDLSNNNISLWQNETFRSLVNLTTLKLNSMFFSRDNVLPNILYGLEQLDSLEMKQNGFEKVPSADFFQTVSGTLTQLVLDDNVLSTLDEKSFSSLPNLRNLSLQNAGIASVARQAFSGLSKLEFLTMGENPITHIGNYSFEDLQALKSLSLRKCGVTYIAPLAFHGLTNVLKLDMTGNLLETLSIEVVSSMPRASWDVFGGTDNDNPMNCNCSLLSLKRWLGDEAKRMKIICYEPLKLRSKYLTDIKEADFGCEDPSIDGCCTTILQALVGQNLTIQCTPHGLPKPEVTFRVTTGDPLPSDRTSIDDNGHTLVIAKIQPSDARTIVCTAKSVLGSKEMTYVVNVTSSGPSKLQWWTILVIVIVAMVVFVGIVLGIWLINKKRQALLQLESDSADISINPTTAQRFSELVIM